MARELSPLFLEAEVNLALVGYQVTGCCLLVVVLAGIANLSDIVSFPSMSILEKFASPAMAVKAPTVESVGGEIVMRQRTSRSKEE